MEYFRTPHQVISEHLPVGTYVVEMDVFSGRPNPTVAVEERMERIMAEFEDHAEYQPTQLASTLGYKGFIVHKRTSPRGDPLEIAMLTVGKGHNRAVERMLLMMFNDIHEHVTAHVIDGIDAGPQQAELPVFNPDAWNDDPFILEHNNCYNYSTNIRTNTFAQPGRFHYLPPPVSPGKALDGCLKDGLKKRDNGDLQDGDTGILALVIWPTNDPMRIHDFHFYRRDAGGNWSHKPGQSQVTNTDSDGQPIIDPMNADRGPYTMFLSYLGKHGSVLIA